MNDLDNMIETSETTARAPAAAASKSAYLGLVVVLAIFGAVFWFRARR